MAMRVESNPLEAAYAALLSQGLDGAGEALRILVDEASKIERSSFLNAQPHERSADRSGYANGFKPKLTMSFVYFNIWQIKQNELKDFTKGLIGFGKDIENDLLGASSPFVFSTVNERSILRLLKLIECDNGKIGS